MTTVRDLTPDDAPALRRLYEEYEWWADRDVEDVRTALAQTEVAVGVEDDADLVAAARVLTDYTYYATVFDVSSRPTAEAKASAGDSWRRSSTTPTCSRSWVSRCSAGADWCRTTSRSASTCSTPRWNYPRVASKN